jgi:DNA-directed RNA polymerase subunit RPC12/RpoP
MSRPNQRYGVPSALSNRRVPLNPRTTVLSPPPPVPRQYCAGQRSLTLASPVGTRRADLSSARVPRSDQPRPRVAISCSRHLPCATNSASSLVRVGAFASLTACSGYSCAGWPRWREALVLVHRPPSIRPVDHMQNGVMCDAPGMPLPPVRILSTGPSVLPGGVRWHPPRSRRPCSKSARWRPGDEIRCPHCHSRHLAVQRYPRDPHPYAQRMLFFDRRRPRQTAAPLHTFSAVAHEHGGAIRAEPCDLTIR